MLFILIMFCVEKQIKLFLLREYCRGRLEGESATISWKAHKGNSKTQSVLQATQVFVLSETLICMCNQMKDWKAAYRSQKHVTLSLPLLSVCELFLYVDTTLHFSGKAESTSCGADVKLDSVFNLEAVHNDTEPVRQSMIRRNSTAMGNL